MNLIRLTEDNASKYIGYEILFKTRGEHIVKKIISHSNKSIKINNPDLHNCLVIKGRKIYVLINFI